MTLFGPIVRDLADDDAPPAAWEPILTIIVLVIMFGVLVLDKVGTDSVMLTALMCFYISGIISIEETLKGFNSQGLLTVLVLFVVAEGLNKTGALNWYVGKLFGRPTTLTGAQLRVMIPITALSGFINDTPLVTIALPIVIQWAKQINVSTRFLLMPLSFAALLGGVSDIIDSTEWIHGWVCHCAKSLFRFNAGSNDDPSALFRISHFTDLHYHRNFHQPHCPRSPH
jgi:Na+/H+ antiporter NhaD/arsenite permease-like protein